MAQTLGIIVRLYSCALLCLGRERTTRWLRLGLQFFIGLSEVKQNEHGSFQFREAIQFFDLACIEDPGEGRNIDICVV